MAIIDSQAIFSDNQEVTEVTNSQRYMDLQSLADYGVGREAYILILIKGNFSKGLRVQLLGSEKEGNFSKCVVVGDTGFYLSSELVAGKEIYLPWRQIDKKYRSVCLRYIPTDDTAPSTGTETPTGNDDVNIVNFAAPPKVGETGTDTPNTLSAYVVLTARTSVDYAHANDEKATA